MNRMEGSFRGKEIIEKVPALDESIKLDDDLSVKKSFSKEQNNILDQYKKDLIYKSLALAMAVSVPVDAQSPNNGDYDNVKNKIEISDPVSPEKENFKQESLKYQDYGMLMSCNLVSEKPTDYQLEQIKQMQDRVIKSLEGKKFNSVSELVIYINQSIDPDFSNQEAALYIKDAFPEKEGEKAKGHHDCDARSIETLSILEKIGISSDQVSFYATEGHSILKIESDGSFIEMTNNTIKNLSKDEQIQLNKIDSFDKYYAYLLGKEGTALSYEADINLFDSSKEMDNEKMLLAFDKIKKSTELDPNNLTNNLNLLKIISKVKIDKSEMDNLVKKISSNIELSLLNNYYGINQSGVDGDNLIIRPEEIASKTVRPRRLEDLGDVNNLTSKALSENEYLQSKFFDLGNDMLYEFDNPDEAIRIFKNLSNSIDLNSLDKDKSKMSSYLLYQRYISNSYFKSGQYDNYLSFTNNELLNLQEMVLKDENTELYVKDQVSKDLTAEEGEITVAKIIIGNIKINESNIGDFCNNYKEDLVFGPIISGSERLNFSVFNANEALEKWSGFENLKKIINDWKSKNK